MGPTIESAFLIFPKIPSSKFKTPKIVFTVKLKSFSAKDISVRVLDIAILSQSHQMVFPWVEFQEPFFWPYLKKVDIFVDF